MEVGFGWFSRRLWYAPPLQQLSLGKYLSMTIYDRATGTVIFQSDTVIFKSQKWDFRSKALVEGTLRI